MNRANLPQRGEFLEDWYETVNAVLPLLGDEWRSNQCNDDKR
jgi:hypothetical protein